MSWLLLVREEAFRAVSSSYGKEFYPKKNKSPDGPRNLGPCFKLIQCLGSVCCLELLEVPRFPCLRIVLYSVHRPTRNMPYFTITGTPIVAYRTFYSLWNEFVQLSAGCLLSMVSCFFRIGRRMILSVTV